MYSHKSVSLLVIFATLLTMINGQFGGFGAPSLFQTAANTAGQFSNSNTNFQQTRGGSFGAVAAFGSGGSTTNFNQQNTNAGKSFYNELLPILTLEHRTICNFHKLKMFCALIFVGRFFQWFPKFRCQSWIQSHFQS